MQLLKEISLSQGRLTYGLTEMSLSTIPTYGIEAATTLFGEKEAEQIRHITTDREFAEKLLYTLADNTVLPSTLKEVVEEYVTIFSTVSA